MIARFPDSKSLAFAYTDLLSAGVQAADIKPCFEEVLPQPAAEHHSFLQRLHRWATEWQHRSEAVRNHQSVAEVPSVPMFKRHGGVLTVSSPTHEQEVIAIIIKHSGELVG